MLNHFCAAGYVCETENQQFIYFAKLLLSFYNPDLLIPRGGYSHVNIW